VLFDPVRNDLSAAQAVPGGSNPPSASLSQERHVRARLWLPGFCVFRASSARLGGKLGGSRRHGDSAL